MFKFLFPYRKLALDEATVTWLKSKRCGRSFV